MDEGDTDSMLEREASATPNEQRSNRRAPLPAKRKAPVVPQKGKGGRNLPVWKQYDIQLLLDVRNAGTDDAEVLVKFHGTCWGDVHCMLSLIWFQADHHQLSHATQANHIVNAAGYP